MKGTLFDNDRELILNIKGDQWHQGEKIAGTFALKHLSEKNDDKKKNFEEKITLKIALGEFKKVQNKDENAFQVLAEETLLLDEKNAQQPFSFQLSLNAPITDKKISPYILFGPLQNLTFSHLQLIVLPHPWLTQIKGYFETFFRFKTKELKTSKIDKKWGGLNLKFIPPQSRDLANMTSLELDFYFPKESTQEIILKYSIDLKKIDGQSAVQKLTSTTQELDFHFQSKDFLLAPNLLNQDFFINHIKSILDPIKLKLM